MDDPSQQYRRVMSRISERFYLVERLRSPEQLNLITIESIAFQLRKITEGLCFACVISAESGTKKKVRSARGQWNADKILNALEKLHVLRLPNPSVLRKAFSSEISNGVTIVIEGIPQKCLSKQEIQRIYKSTHFWLHEINPFLSNGTDFFETRAKTLLRDVDSVFDMLERHFISISGVGFYCSLRDKETGDTRVLPLNKLVENA